MTCAPQKASPSSAVGQLGVCGWTEGPLSEESESRSVVSGSL